VFDIVRKTLLNHGHDIALLDLWFKQDLNALPPVHILQPISSILRHFKDKVCYAAVNRLVMKLFYL